MLTRIIKEPSFSGIAAGAIASARAFTRGNIVNFYLFAKTGAGAALTRAQILNDIGDIALKVNGIVLFQVDADLLLDRQKYLGDAVGAGNVDGVIPIPMELAHLPTAEQRFVPALGTADVNTIAIEATIDAVAQLSTLELFTEVNNEPNEPVGDHIRIQKFSRTFGTTGLQEISDLPFQDENVKGILAMHLRHSTGTASEITVKRNGLVVIDKVVPNLNQVLLDNGLRTVQSGYDHIDFGRHRSLNSLLPMKDTTSLIVEINWTVAAPNTYSIFMERVFKELR